jgi:hypothetical protein
MCTGLRKSVQATPDTDTVLEAGDAASARDQYIALLPILEQVRDPEHPETLTARANLAHWTGQAKTTCADAN